MTKKRIVLLILSGTLLLAAVAVLLVMENLDALVEKAVESAASKATGTAVQVGRVSLSLREGHGSISELTIANPPGFSAQPLLSLASIEIRIDPAQLAEPVPVIDEIRVGPAIFSYEINPFGESNLHLVQKQARNRQPAQGPPASDASKSRAEEKRFRIRRLIVAEGTAALQLGQIGAGQGAARVPGMTLNDLGGPQGATAEELAGEIVAALGKNLSAAVGGDGMKRLGDSLGEAFRKLRQR